MKEVFIDVETGGLDSKVNPILQLSGEIRIDGELKESFDYFMQPFKGELLDEEALKVTGFTIEQIRGFSKPETVFKEFTKLLDKYINKWDKKDKAHMLCYNKGFDESFLREFFIKNSKTEKDREYGNGFGCYFTYVLCVMQLALFDTLKKGVRHLLKNMKLKTVYEFYFGIDDSINWHDAKADITATRRMFYFIFYGVDK